MRKIFIITLLCAVVAGAVAQEERLFREAERRYAAGDFRFALSRYEELLEEYPRSSHIADAQYRKAVIYYRIGQPQQALEGLRRVEQRYPYTQYARYLPFWKGVVRYELGEYEKAVDELKAYLQKKDATFRQQALFYTAMGYRTLGNKTAALEAAEKAVKTAGVPEDAPQITELYASLLVQQKSYEKLDAFVQGLDTERLPEESARSLSLYRAEALFRQERYKEAEPLYTALTQEEGEARRIAYKRLFVLYQRTGREQKRDEIFDAGQRALAGQPELLNEFLLRVGIESYKKGALDLAESYLRRIWRNTESASVDALVPLYLAGVLERRGEYERAASIIEEYRLGSDSREQELLFALGRIYTAQGEWGKAAETLSLLFSRYPRTQHERKGTYLLAFSRYKTGEMRKALAVINDLFSRGEEGELYAELLRLKSRLHLRLGELQEALDTLGEYLPLYPKDSGAYVDAARIRFSRGEYRRVLERTATFEEQLPDASKSAPDHYSLVRYMEGLSRLALGEYSGAARVLEELRMHDYTSNVTDNIAPYLLFYQGWAYYEANELERAFERFTALIDRFPQHENATRAQYYAGWSAYALERYEEAARFFTQYGSSADNRDERSRGRYMYAQSLAAEGRSDEAMAVYRSLFQDSPDSPFADEALYEYAGQLKNSGEPQQAVESYQRLYRQYPSSSFAEDALYTRGEVLYNMEKWEAARNAFYAHRTSYPEGELVPFSLYWGGKAAQKNGAPYGAALLWEKLVEEFADSSLHRDALGELAALYAEQGEYEKALQYFNRLQSLYPDKAAELEAERRIETLKKVLQGTSEREAELQVVYENEGLDNKKGRSAALELAKMYLYRFSGEETRARTLLEQLVEKAPETKSGAEAHYYLGEYYMRRGNWEKAARTFFEAALSAGGDADFVARAMYKAAENAVQAGDAAGARRMIDRLESEFPDSQWVKEGRELLSSVDGEGESR